MSKTAKVSIGYVAVHNAYQQAQAAAEGGMLSKFYCSAHDAPGFWGRTFTHLVGRDKLASVSGVDLPSSAVVEHPWPMLRKRVLERVNPRNENLYFESSERFDRWVADQMPSDPCDLYVGYETCAEYAFAAAHAQGKKCLLDCPQFHPVFLWELLAEAAELCAQPAPAPIDTPQMAARKAMEFASADTLLVYSEVHALSFRKAGFDHSRIVVSPLWFDPSLWRADHSKRREWDGVLRLLFVGGASLRKGIPFLLQAMRPLAPRVRLGLAGVVFDDMKPVIAANEDLCELLGPQSKPALRDIYRAHDLLVLPSVADAFGFVALEAMSCGIPVVVTSTCGAPVPEESWRVPAMNVEALQARFEHYLSNPSALASDGQLAETFVRDFTAETFRARMRDCFVRAASDPLENGA